MVVCAQLEYVGEVLNPHTINRVRKIKQIQRNSCRFIFQDYARDTNTSLISSLLYQDSLYTCRLIQQAIMFYKIHCIFLDMSFTLQHASNISDRIDHTLKYCNMNPSHIDAYEYSFFPHSMNAWNRFPCSAVLYVTHSR